MAPLLALRQPERPIQAAYRIEVIDDGGATVPAVTAARQWEDPDISESGRGLRLVDVLSARWNYYCDPAGTVTWFELTGYPRE